MMTRGFTVAWAASLLVAGALVVLSGHNSQAQGAGSSCEDAGKLAVLASPVAPWKGAPLRIVFTSEQPLDGELSLIAPDGAVAVKSHERHGGPPYSWFAEVAAPAAGTWHAKLARDGAAPTARRSRARSLSQRCSRRRRADGKERLACARHWNRGTENLYSAWIEKLFDAPLDKELSWPALHEVLRDKSRNFLFNHLGLGEDEKKLIIQPDCADLPYFLRAYFAFKMGLPFGYSKCSRGGGGKAPKCPQWWNIQRIPPATREKDAGSGSLFGMFDKAAAQTPVVRPSAAPGACAGIGYYVRARRSPTPSIPAPAARLPDDNTDYYPVSLKAETLRPGTIYADPYGHVLVLVKRIAQTDEAAGVFLAVDGQPDGTVARKRFWRGNFLFAQNPSLGSPGFKRFRPIVADKNGGLRRLTNAEISKDSQYGDFSLEQSQLGVEDFYDRMDDVMSPAAARSLTRDEGDDHGS